MLNNNKVEELALSTINHYVDLGMQIPSGFNPTNSLKKARMILNEMKVSGKPVLQVCSPQSVVQCLVEACCKGLDYSENQIYFIPRGNQLTNLESVYGRITRARRASRYYKPIVQYVHEGDDFEFGVDTNNGKTFIKKHETNLENLDKPIIAAYTFVTDDNNDTEVFIMTKREWITSWKKSPNGCSVAKEFERDMIYRTIIKKSTKSLVNANTTNIYQVENSNDDDDTPLGGENIQNEQSRQEEIIDLQEAEEVESVEVVEEVPSEEIAEEQNPKLKRSRKYTKDTEEVQEEKEEPNENKNDDDLF